MKKIVILLIMIIGVTLYGVAQDNSFYFIGKSTPQGIYLRWDDTEGNFPTDSNISLIQLKRYNKVILEFAPNEIMSEDKIKALYANSQNIDSLKRVIAIIAKNSDTSSGCSGANMSNYATKIQGCLQNDFWRYASLKLDFNLAQVSYRAFLDKNITTQLNKSTIDYELNAIRMVDSDHNKTQRLGKISIDPKKYNQILPAENFHQVYQRVCNAPEYAKDDYTVALTWKSGGNKTDSFANSIMVSGYDIYRDKEYHANKQNFASLLNSATIDDNGNYQIPSLEKVNDSLILLSNQQKTNEALFLETKDRLKKAGLKPSDKRWYYLVPRDFTGVYGKDSALLVTIPNLLPPPTPWGVKVIEDNKKMELIWENMNIKSYFNHYKNSKKFCNIKTITPKERLLFVDRDKSCGDGNIEVNLNIKKYLVYRFDNPAQAGRFIDTDLDGIEDIKEKKGEVCIKNSIKKPPLVKILNSADFQHQQFIHFRDSGAKIGRRYWYRVVAVTDSDIGSIPTAPIPAMIPDRTLPKKPNIIAKTCSNSYIIASYTLDGGSDYLAYDDTGKAKFLRIKCQRGDYVILIPVNRDHTFNFDDRVCKCYNGTIEFLDARGNVLASKPLCSINSCRASEFYVLQNNEDCRNGRYIPIHAGTNLSSFPIFDIPIIKDDECIEFSRVINGKRYRSQRYCNPPKQINSRDLNISNLGKGTQICIGANILNANNQYSPTKYIPCFGVIDYSSPKKPDIRDLKINDNNISVTWLPPQEKIASTIISLYNDDNKSQSFLRTYAHPNQVNETDFNGLEFTRDILLNGYDKKARWCAKAKSVGFNGKTSDWSSLRCQKNITPKERTEYLPWPKINMPKESHRKLDFIYNSNFLIGLITPIYHNADIKLFLNRIVEPKYMTYFYSYMKYAISGTIPNKTDMDRMISHNIAEIIINSFNKKRYDFVLYRQKKFMNKFSNFIQVSPFIHQVDYDENTTIFQISSSYTTSAMRQKPLYAILAKNNFVIIFSFTKFDVDVTTTGEEEYIGVDATLYYQDRYPYKAYNTYRYTKVDFDINREIYQYTTSNEVKTGEKKLILLPLNDNSGDIQTLPLNNLIPLNNIGVKK